MEGSSECLGTVARLAAFVSLELATDRLPTTPQCHGPWVSLRAFVGWPMAEILPLGGFLGVGG